MGVNAIVLQARLPHRLSEREGRGVNAIVLQARLPHRLSERREGGLML